MNDRTLTKIKKITLLLAVNLVLSLFASRLAAPFVADGDPANFLWLSFFLFTGLVAAIAVLGLDKWLPGNAQVKEVLDTITLPAAVMDGGGRIILCNQLMDSLIDSGFGDGGSGVSKLLTSVVNSGGAAIHDFFDVRAMMEIKDRQYNVEEHVMTPDSGFPPPHRLVVLHDITRLARLRSGLREIAGGIGQIGENSSKLSTSSASLSQGVSAQSASLSAITKGMDEFSKKIQGNSESASKGSQLASQAREAAERSGSEITNALSAMTDVQDAGVRIARIVKLIDDIAFQTNLLALNAAVEAARAGRQGKGFAVVADEVRNLAGRSAKAAKDTASMVEDVTERIGNASLYISKLKEILGNIVQDAIRMADSSADASNISSEQAAGITSVNRELSQLNNATNLTISAAQQASTVVVTLTQQVSDLRERLSQAIGNIYTDPNSESAGAAYRGRTNAAFSLAGEDDFRDGIEGQNHFSGFRRLGDSRSGDNWRGDGSPEDYQSLSTPGSYRDGWSDSSPDAPCGFADSDEARRDPLEAGLNDIRTTNGDRMVRPSQNIVLDDSEFGRY